MTLVEARKKKLLTQANLGAMIGVSQQAVARYENGLCTPSVCVMRKMSDALGVPINDIMNMFDEKSDSAVAFEEKNDERPE